MKGVRADAELVLYCNAVDVAHDKGSASCSIRSHCRVTAASHCPPPPPPAALIPQQRRSAGSIQEVLGQSRALSNIRQVIS